LAIKKWLFVPLELTGFNYWVAGVENCIIIIITHVFNSSASEMP